MTFLDRRPPVLAGILLALAFTALANDDLKDAPKREWDDARDFPVDVRSQRHVKWDYPIAYVRIPRPYPKAYAGINHLNQAGLHQTNAPGAELRLLHPDGRDEPLVAVKPAESITDPMVSFDGQWVYYAKFHHISTGPSASMTKIQSKAGSDIYRINVKTRQVVQLTHQERTPNTAAVAPGEESHPRGVHNLGPCPVAGGRVVFVSDRNGVRGVREQTQPAAQLFVMDDDGANVEHIGPMNLGGALHPVALVDGRVMFSSLETQGLRSDERWGIWHVDPDGTNWGPLTSALGSPPGQAVHFQAQLSDQSIVVESYYQTGSTDGFGTFWRFPLKQYGELRFAGGTEQYKPLGMVDMTRFASFEDVRPNHKSRSVNNRPYYGNVTHPSGAPDGHLLLVWTPPGHAQDQSTDVYDAGIYLIPDGRAINHPSKMVTIKNDPAYQEVWPRAVIPYKRIYGVDEPKKLEHVNDGSRSPHLPAGTPFGLVGSSSLYKRESYPGGKVAPGSVTATSSARKPGDRKAMWRELSVARFGRISNWGEQGGEAGLYANDDIWGIRILVLEPVTDATFKRRRHFALGSNAEERIRVLGEFPVRKFDGDAQPTDPDGNPDTSFLAKLPADVAWTFQTLDNHGMVLNMAQTWHQVRPGEVRTDCGGCHAHSQQPTDFAKTAAAKPDFKPWDLTERTPLFATKVMDQTGKKWDAGARTGVRFASAAVANVEFYRDIKPLLDRSCVACHTGDDPAGKLPLDDYKPHGRRGLVPWAENVQLPKELPRTYARLVQYAWAFQSRRSPLIWKLHGRRMDGFANEDVESPKIDYDDDKDVLNWCHHSKRFQWDVDHTGMRMPPPDAVAGTFRDDAGKPVRVPDLSEEEKLTFARWIDLGCPIDLDFDPADPVKRGRGWMLDEGRPTLTLPFPRPGTNAAPLTEIVIGTHDYYTGLDPASLRVTADFDLDGVPQGTDLAPRFERLDGGRYRLRLNAPLRSVTASKLTVSVRDREGNVTRIERTFSIQPPARP